MNGRALAQAAVTFNGTGAVLPVTASGIAVQQPPGVNLTNNVSTNNFGSVVVGTNTSLTFTVTNTGSANLTGLSVAVEGVNSNMFTVTTNPATSVIPGGSTTFTVSFAPTNAGVQTAALQIASNDPTNNPFDITIIGKGVAAGAVPVIVVQQPVGIDLTNDVSTNNFGSVPVGTNTSLQQQHRDNQKKKNTVRGTFTATNFRQPPILPVWLSLRGVAQIRPYVHRYDQSRGSGDSWRQHHFHREFRSRQSGHTERHPPNCEQ